MALIFLDGFDHYNNPLSKYTGVGGANQGQIDLTGAQSRTGIGAYVAGGVFGPFLSFTLRSTLIIGVAIKASGNLNGALYRLLEGGASGGTQIQVNILTTGAIQVVGGPVPFQYVIATSPPNIIFGGVYAYVELLVTAGVANGSLTLRVNGATVATATNVNTDPEHAGGYDTVQLMGPTGGASLTFDDLYIFDNFGPFNNTFAGPIRIFTALPTSDSSPLNWVPSTPGTHFNLVNGVPAESQVSYVSSANVNDIDQYLYNTSLVPSNANILAVQHDLDALLDAAGSGSVGSSCGGIATGSIALSTSPHIYRVDYDTDPTTGLQWVLANLPIRPFGPKRTA